MPQSAGLHRRTLLEACFLLEPLKSIITRGISRRAPSVKKQLLGGTFWPNAFTVNTIGHHE